MSQVSAAARTMPSGYARPSTPPLRRPEPPRLRVVAPAKHRSAGGLALLSIALLGAGLMALLMLNISIGKGAYELSALQRQQRELAVSQQELSEQVEQAGAPQELARAARELGMVPAPNTVFVKVPDGKVQGAKTVAPEPPKPVKKNPGTAAGTAAGAGATGR
jgi:hypothetical protein